MGEGTVGLITYMRTDGVDLAPEAVAATRRAIGKEFGDAYVPTVPRKYTSKQKKRPEAHEAIARPTWPAIRGRWSVSSSRSRRGSTS